MGRCNVENVVRKEGIDVQGVETTGVSTDEIGIFVFKVAEQVEPKVKLK